MVKLTLFSGEARRREATEAERAGAGAGSSSNPSYAATTTAPENPLHKAFAALPHLHLPAAPAKPTSTMTAMAPAATMKTASPLSATSPAIKLGHHTVTATDKGVASPNTEATIGSAAASSTTGPLSAPAPAFSAAVAPPTIAPTAPSAPQDLLSTLIKPAISGTTSAPPSSPSQPSPFAVPPPTAWMERVHWSQMWQKSLQDLAVACPEGWETLVGLYFQQSGRSPQSVGDASTPILGARWRVDTRRIDCLEKDPADPSIEKWEVPTNDGPFMAKIDEVNQGGLAEFEAAIRWWSINQRDRAGHVLEKAGWRKDSRHDADWQWVSDLLAMADSEHKRAMVAQARALFPRYFQECLDDGTCGTRRVTLKRTAEDENDPDYFYDDKWAQAQFRIRGSVEFTPIERHPPKRLKMSIIGQGRPTQFHGVPVEERYVDSKGVRMPWALEWPDGHPNARGQKRHVEEKGPFGKSSRRKGSSRTRTATPAKKENPTLDGFERALKYSAKKAAEAQEESNASTRPQTDMHGSSHNAPSHEKEPTSVILYGFSSSTQWSAINTYERASQGMICEDYDREPPAELQKYPKTFSSGTSVHRRPLTQQERRMAFKYAGGKHWIKVTFDSAEAANRAIEHSPFSIYGKWVYAELYHGEAPTDEEIPILEGEQEQGRPARRPAQTLSAAFAQQASHQQRATATLPRSFNPPAMSQADDQRPNGALSSSPSTASSATATGPEYPNLRHRHQSQTQEDATSTVAQNATPGQYDPRFMRHFPHIPRTVIRPAHEAFLPVPTFTERCVQWLRANGWLPGDFIGDGAPRDPNGNFDWNAATWYWRFWYTFDNYFGTDVCGLRAEN